MIVAILIAAITFSATAVLHLHVLHRLSSSMDARLSPGPVLWVGTFLLVGLLHLTEAGFYAAALTTGQGLGLGGFASTDGAAGWMDTFYFALVSYTSLGLGDIYPTGHLRLIAGVASLNGFLLISCSAALLFRMISRPDHKDETEREISTQSGSARPAPSIPGRQRPTT